MLFRSVGLMIDYLRNPADLALRARITGNLGSFTRSQDYKNILLIDTTGQVLLSYPENQDTLIGEHVERLIPELIHHKTVFLTDLQQTGKMSFIHLDLVVPLIDKSRNDTLATGLLALRVDPREVLYPLVQTWPVPSKTAETLLIRQEGDEVVFLNELRFRRNSELVLRKPVSDQSLPASLAVRGIESTTNGIDYRGAEVVAVMKKVPGSNWYMVAKVDHNEVFSVLDDQMTMVIIIVILFILTTGLILGIIEWNDNVRFYRGKYEAELDHLALRKHFDYILKYANDIIFLTDRNQVIVEANDRAVETYLYDRNDLIGMNISKIRAPELAAKF